ncbi:MAG: MFS transporter [Betaproteobacteria bacterium]|nr:MAG: MFS transporter [Betaproteobacteria bacterium]
MKTSHAPASFANEQEDAWRGRTESPYAWMRLAVTLLLSTIGGVGMWSVVVALPAVQAEFGAARADASLSYTATMIGFGFSGILMGRLSDRFGVIVPVIVGTVAMAAGYTAAGFAGNLSQYTVAQGILIGVGSSATFAPLLAHTSLWFTRRRGIAVAIFASGNYLAGTIWPPIVQHFIASAGWRDTYFGIGAFCAATMLPLALLLRRPPPLIEIEPGGVRARARPAHGLGLSSRALQTLLVIAGLSCCVAMSMPQVHLVAYCGDLGYGAARGAQMLSLMLACGIVSRLTFGFICDRIGGLRTLLLGSSLQCIALLLFLPFDGLVSLYVISALFGLFQGGIVPSYAIIVREYFPPTEAGARVGTVIMATLFGMALGGWMSGAIFDLTGSYKAAFLNGTLWNLVNLSIALLLLKRSLKRSSPESARA